VPFDLPMSTLDYYLVGSIENTVDVEPAKYGFNISNTTVSGFDIELSDITDSANYQFNYTVVDSDVQSVGIPIPGPQGETGVSGIQGIQGIPAGVSGIQGIQGIPGEGVATTSGSSGQYDIPNATDNFTVSFPVAMVDTDYFAVGTIENTVDVETAKYGFTIENTAVGGFTVDLTDITDSANYKFNWVVVANPIEVIGVAVPGPQGEQGVQGIQGIQGETGASGTPGPTDHGLLTGLGDDDHTQYTLANGSRAFTSTVSGVTPTLDPHLTTKNYVDNAITTATGSLTSDHGDLIGLDDNDHPQYLLETDFTVYSGTLQTDIDTKISDVVDDTTPQLGGDLELNDHNIVLTSIPGTNQTANGMVVPMTVDANDQGFGSPLYMATDGNLEMADASSSATAPCVAMALEAGTGTKDCCLLGFVRNDSWNWTSLGGVEGLIYISTTSGVLTQTLVSGSGNQVQTVGYATHADRMYFNPQLPMVEIA